MAEEKPVVPGGWHQRAINSVQFSKDWRGLREEYLRLASDADQSEMKDKLEIRRLSKLLDEHKITH